jgi:hypothetical protein
MGKIGRGFSPSAALFLDVGVMALFWLPYSFWVWERWSYDLDDTGYSSNKDYRLYTWSSTSLTLEQYSL